MAYANIYVGENVQSFKSSPKFDNIDMVILNLDENNFVSSPYAKIVDMEVSEAALMTNTALTYAYIGNETGYTRNRWYRYTNGAWAVAGTYTPWRNRSNGRYTFTYDAAEGKWKYGSTYYSADEMLLNWAVEVYYSASDAGKAGDTITVVKFSDSDPESEEQEKQSLELNCEITRSGRTMEANCPLVKPAARQNIADSLLANLRNYQYQPFTAGGAEVNPLAELGDGITAHGMYGGLYQQDLEFNSLMTSDIAAPADEELDHEYTYESASERKYSRKFADIGAEFKIHADEIEARVTKIGTGDGFSWRLVYESFSVKAGTTEVFKVDKDGTHVIGDGTFTGTVYATAGEFTGTVKASQIQGSTITGGSINIGNGNFVVDSNGNLTANSGTFNGNVYAKNIQYGGSAGTFSGAGLTPQTIGYNNSGALVGSWYSGAVGGNLFDESTYDYKNYPSYFRAGYIMGVTGIGCGGSMSVSSISIGGQKALKSFSRPLTSAYVTMSFDYVYCMNSAGTSSVGVPYVSNYDTNTDSWAYGFFYPEPTN